MTGRKTLLAAVIVPPTIILCAIGLLFWVADSDDERTVQYLSAALAPGTLVSDIPEELRSDLTTLSLEQKQIAFNDMAVKADVNSTWIATSKSTFLDIAIVYMPLYETSQGLAIKETAIRGTDPPRGRRLVELEKERRAN